MKSLLRLTLISKLFLLTLLLMGRTSVAAGEKVTMDGSSTVYPIAEALAEEFQIAKKNAIKVTVGISGTGGGFKRFCRGETDISNASRPILASEIKACATSGIKFYEVPLAFDALAVVVNSSNTSVKQMTVAELRTAWESQAQGKVKNWQQLNPAFPDMPLSLYGPGADSGTFDYFTEAVNGKSKSSRGDYTASEDDNVLVQGVAGDKGGLGYFGYAYYIANQKKLRAVPIVNKSGKAILPSEAAIIDGSYNPLSRPLFIYISEKSLARPEVKEFVDFTLKNAATYASEVKYAPLPKAIYGKIATRINEKKLGTVFGGIPDVGVTIEELVSRETSH